MKDDNTLAKSVYFDYDLDGVPSDKVLALYEVMLTFVLSKRKCSAYFVKVRFRSGSLELGKRRFLLLHQWVCTAMSLFFPCIEILEFL